MLTLEQRAWMAAQWHAMQAWARADALKQSLSPLDRTVGERQERAVGDRFYLMALRLGGGQKAPIGNNPSPCMW